MRFQPSTRYRLTLLLIGLCLLFLPVFVAAQDEPPAPTFLYREENRLLLLDGYTGETTELPFEVAAQDRFEWSPDGKYLLARFRNDEDYSYCLNLYEIGIQKWISDEGISCDAQGAKFSSDGTQLIYSTIDGDNAVLWQYSPEDEQSHEIYRTTEGSELRPNGIDDFQWSPTETYFTFIHYYQIMGGTLNNLVVMNMETMSHIIVNAPSSYYASYSPVWSADDSWFLITLKENYVTSGTLPFTNHLGDVYLVNTETGDQYRLTYTPATYEQDVRWTEDGHIAFDFMVVTEHALTFTTEQAMNIEPIPSEEIVWPEPVDAEDYFPVSNQNHMLSPDPNHAAWVLASTTDGNNIYELNIGSILGGFTPYFSIPLPEDYLYKNILIGWRPSDYHYPQG